MKKSSAESEPTTEDQATMKNVIDAIESTPPPEEFNSPTSDELISNWEFHNATTGRWDAFDKFPKKLQGISLAKYENPKTLMTLLLISDAPVFGNSVEFLSPEKTTRLKDLAAEYAAEFQHMLTFSVRQAIEDFQAQRSDLKDHAAKRGQAFSGDITFRKLDSFQQDYQEKRAACNLRLQMIDADYLPLVKEAILTAEKYLKSMLRYIETGERAIADAYSVEWEPSSIFKSCAIQIVLLRGRINSFSGGGSNGPVELLRGLIEL